MQRGPPLTGRPDSPGPLRRSTLRTRRLEAALPREGPPRRRRPGSGAAESHRVRAVGGLGRRNAREFGQGSAGGRQGDPCACIGGRRKRGQQGQALGRSRGGFSTKIHLKTNFDGLPIAFDLTGGQAADSPHFETLMDLGPDVRPRVIVADKGYDSAGNRQLARKRGALTVIPYRKNTKNRPKRFAGALYRGRARIEQAVGKLKRFKRIALRCEKTATNFGSFVALAAAFILIKSVHRA